MSDDISALLIRSKAYRQEEEWQHSVLPAAALLCGIPLLDLYCVLTSLPALLGVVELCLEYNRSTSLPYSTCDDADQRVLKMPCRVGPLT